MKKSLILIFTILFFCNSYSQCGQYIQNMLSTMSDVKFWDENNGIVIGGSTVLTTHNGGISWESYALPHHEIFSRSPLTDIELIGTAKGFVFGKDGIILFTDNNGINWERRIGITGSENFSGVNFIDDNIGYLVGEEATAFLYKTSDSGHTWSEVTSNISSIDYGNSSPNDLLFLDENTGFVWGGNKFHKTIDGGETWFEIDNPSNYFIQKLQFTDSQTAFLSSGNIIYKTTDGGDSWLQTNYATGWGGFTVKNDNLFYADYIGNGIKKVNINGGIENSVVINQEGFLTDIYFINDAIGIAVGRKEQSGFMGRFIYKTLDGGQSWLQLDGGAPISGGSDSANYFKKVDASEYLFSVGTSGSYKRYSILRSQDEGASWKMIHETQEGISGKTLFADGDYISYWRYAVANNAGAGYIISESFDKGLTWIDGPVLKSATLPNDVNYNLSNLTQVSQSKLFAFSYGNLYQSVDKGVTWNLISTPNDLGTKQYQFIDENNFMLYGRSSNSEPTIYRTDDGGVTWDFVLQISGYSYSLQFDRFDFSDPNRIYLYPRYPGDKLFTYDITNQNLTENNIPYFINKIKTVADNSVIILDNNANLYISHDTGVTWSQRAWGGGPTSYPNIYVENENNIFLWDYNFIQNLKSYLPTEPELIFGNENVIINTEEEYIIPVDLFTSTEWVLESGGTLISDPNTDYYKTKVVWETEGSHRLKVKRTNDCGESITTEINITVNSVLGVEDYTTGLILVYPNPFNEKIKLSIPQKFLNKDLYITLTSILGQIVYKKKQNYTIQNIELNDIPKSINDGIYFFKIESDNANVSKKLIKN